MSGPMGVEAVFDATKRYLQDHQAAAIAAVSARDWEVNIGALPNLQAIRFCDPSRTAEPLYPALFIVPVETELQGTKGGGSIEGLTPWCFWIVGVHVGELAEGNTAAEQVRRIVTRYALAVLDMLRDMAADTSGTYYANGQRVLWGTADINPRIEYSLNYTNPNGAHFADCRVIIGAEHSEEPA